MKAPIPNNSSGFKYPSVRAWVIDLMASSIIPLFYAFENYKPLLTDFLNQYNNRHLINEYTKICQTLYNVLNDRNKNLKKELVFLEEKKVEITGWLKSTKAKSYQTLESDQWYTEQCHELQQEVFFLSNQINTLRDLTAHPVDELKTFLEEIRLYCANPGDGCENLEIYFKYRDELVALLHQHHDLFNKVAYEWIDYVMKKKSVAFKTTTTIISMPV